MNTTVTSTYHQGSKNSSSQDQRAQSSTSSSKRHARSNKRNRTIFNVAQLDALAKIFQANQYPDAPLRRKIAERLDIDEEKIQVRRVLVCTSLLKGIP